MFRPLPINKCITKVGTSRCDVTARVAAGGMKRARSVRCYSSANFRSGSDEMQEAQEFPNFTVSREQMSQESQTAEQKYE
jgi:hypothetical protein